MYIKYLLNTSDVHSNKKAVSYHLNTIYITYVISFYCTGFERLSDNNQVPRIIAQDRTTVPQVEREPVQLEEDLEETEED